MMLPRIFQILLILVTGLPWFYAPGTSAHSTPSTSTTSNSTITAYGIPFPALQRRDNVEYTCPKDTVMCHLPHNWNCCPSSARCCGPGCCAAGSHCVDLGFGKCCPDGKRLCGGVCVDGECCGKGGCGKGERCCGGGCCKADEVCDFGRECVRVVVQEGGSRGWGGGRWWVGGMVAVVLVLLDG